MKLNVSNLSFSYGEKSILKDLHFSVSNGTFCSLIGSNGVGKSTLLKCMLGIYRDYQGQISIDGEDICFHKPKELARKMAYIPQSHIPAFHYSVLDMVLMGTTSAMTAFANPKEREVLVAREALMQLQISHLEQRDFMKLSGGEQQLVLIARALAQNARILIMDEPTANLDYGNQLRVLDQMKKLTKGGYTVIQSTHQPEQAYLYSDQILAIKDGAVYGDGPPEQIMSEQLIRDLYGIETKEVCFMEDQVRVYVPAYLAQIKEDKGEK